MSQIISWTRRDVDKLIMGRPKQMIEKFLFQKYLERENKKFLKLKKRRAK